MAMGQDGIARFELELHIMQQSGYISEHDRLIGRPGRITGLVRFLDHIAARDRVWIATGRDIAEHWRRVHPS